MFAPTNSHPLQHRIGLARSRSRRPWLPSARGYTLLELLLVIGILGVLTTLTAQSANMALGKRTVEAVTQQFAMDIQYAKSQAIAQGRNVALRFTNTVGNTPGCYTLYFAANGECTCQASGNTICTGESNAIKTVLVPTTYQVSMRSNVESMQIEYSRGLVTPTGSITLASMDGPALKQVVNIAGRVRTCALTAPSPGYPLC